MARHKRNLDHGGYVLDELAWTYRHGRRVKGGRLKAKTCTDYLCFECPCGAELYRGQGIGWEGVLFDEEAEVPKAHLYRIDCPCCGYRDFFKLEVAETGRRGTAKVKRPADWPREGGACSHEHYDGDPLKLRKARDEAK